VIEFSIVQSGDQVGGPRTAGRQTHADLASEFGVGYGHEGRHFLVPNLDEVDCPGSLERSDHAVNAIARITVDAANSPSVQPFDDEITDFHVKTPDRRESMRLRGSDLAA
jgi:hypothetical protein